MKPEEEEERQQQEEEEEEEEVKLVQLTKGGDTNRKKDSQGIRDIKARCQRRKRKKN
jgi:hypothetical protein